MLILKLLIVFYRETQMLYENNIDIFALHSNTM